MIFDKGSQEKSEKQEKATVSYEAAQYFEPPIDYFAPKRLWHYSAMVGTVLLFVVSWDISEVDLGKLLKGITTVAGWLLEMFPPNFSNIAKILYDAAETVAMATIGTFMALIVAFPLAFLAARNTTPNPVVYHAVRVLFTLSRGTETLVFALIFVVAVGFGPFTGVLAIAFHMVGAIGKLFAESLEPISSDAADAMRMTGASRWRVFRYAVIPEVMPQFVSVTLYFWEFSVRTSTILGIVGAGGIGQTLKDTIDLLDFPQMIVVLGVILIMVQVIDHISDRLRKMVITPDPSLQRAAPRRTQLRPIR
ncbi:MAG: phosphonate ABC transporter, permease protein PhnE [Rickettsiales bacterium TMED131]|nr:MAG: phosphonate ABC transporter, permease protein PhnE [Rickettsiales bacterium TMED131]